MELETNRLLLREFEESDLVALFDMENHYEMQRYEKEKIPSEELIRKYIHNARMCASVTPRTHYYFAVTVKPDNIARGRISLCLLHDHIREWEIGWTTHRADWGKGYAVEAAAEVLNLAFQRLNAHRVVAFCHSLNAQSIRVMEKLGMQKDGLLRETRRWGGRWADECIYSILEREWASP